MPDSKKMTAAIHAYVEGFSNRDPGSIAALYAVDASVEDPIGSPLKHGREAILEFYTEAVMTGAQLTLQGPIRVGGNFAAFAFSVNLTFGGVHQRIDVIDTFCFNEANEITEMRAFWGPENMHGFQ